MIARGIYSFAAIEAVDDVLGPVPEPFPMHVDHLLIVSLEHDAHLYIEYAVSRRIIQPAPPGSTTPLALVLRSCRHKSVRCVARRKGLAQREDWHFEDDGE